MNIALENANVFMGLRTSVQVTQEQIMSIFKAMIPDADVNMGFSTRGHCIALLIKMNDDYHYDKEGLLELFNWAKKNETHYGPHFELLDPKTNKSVKYFKNHSELLHYFNCNSNKDLVETVYPQLHDSYNLLFIPIIDSVEPCYGLKNTNLELNEQLLEKINSLGHYKNYPDVVITFQKILKDFNEKKNPSIRDIVAFTKEMSILHPLIDGNGRTFILGVMNQLLMQNNYGLCLNVNPKYFVSISTDEIVKSIKENLIPLPQNSKKNALTETEFFNQQLSLN